MAQYAINRREIEAILAEAKLQEVPAASTVGAEAIPDFCGIYRQRVRPILLVIVAFLKVINKAWADAVAMVVAFADSICPV